MPAKSCPSEPVFGPYRRIPPAARSRTSARSRISAYSRTCAPGLRRLHGRDADFLPHANRYKRSLAPVSQFSDLTAGFRRQLDPAPLPEAESPHIVVHVLPGCADCTGVTLTFCPMQTDTSEVLPQ